MSTDFISTFETKRILPVIREDSCFAAVSCSRKTSLAEINSVKSSFILTAQKGYASKFFMINRTIAQIR